MKLKHLLFFVLLFSSLSLSICQTSWLKDDAQWVYRTKYGGDFTPPSFGYQVVRHKLDTIVDSMNCKIYERYGSLFSQASLDTVEFSRNDILLCEQENRVYFYDPDIEDFFTIYDFTQPTDTLTIFYQSSWSDTPCYDLNDNFNEGYYTHAQDTFLIDFNGIQRSAQTVTIFEINYLTSLGTFDIIEGMGLVRYNSTGNPAGYIIPGLRWPCVHDPGWSATPCSYSDNELDVQFQDTDCFFLESTPSSTKNILSQDLVKISPNPSHQSINIHSSLSLVSLEIQNIQGQSLLQQIYQDELDVSAFANGMYLLILYTNTGKKVIKRMVKN
ncbi:MAG: T9SS type A sorting domain-containing protein [Saprospiraceae bacterium]|nr:T9SS type A sorting domain-containing protein [Saprospiraceae bacterium]